jgi:hypothetical protein
MEYLIVEYLMDDIERGEKIGKIYINSLNKEGFSTNLDDIWKLIYNRKDIAKKRLVKCFKLNIDYTINIVKFSKERGGSNNEQIFLTPNCLKKFIILAISASNNTAIIDYLIYVEKIFWEIMKNKETKKTHEFEYACVLSMKDWMESELSNIQNETNKHDLVSDKLAFINNGTREFILPNGTGVADVITDTEIIEVKPINEWKHGIGQLICYTFESDKIKHLHLYGGIPTKLIKDICKINNIILTYE